MDSYLHLPHLTMVCSIPIAKHVKFFIHLPEKIVSIIDGCVSWYSVHICRIDFFGLVPCH